MPTTTSPLRHPRLIDRSTLPASLDPVAVAAAMNRIREQVHLWLDRLESLMLANPESDPATEQLRARLQAEIDRHQQQWEAQVEAIDHDRRLLAEAWERLEHEQVVALSRPRSGQEPVRPARPASPPTHASPAPERVDMVDQAILRQFEALRRDVRRTAESRDASSS